MRWSDIVHFSAKYCLFFGSQIGIFSNDGFWHSIGASWENKGGSWKIYKAPKPKGHDWRLVRFRFSDFQIFFFLFTKYNINVVYRNYMKCKKRKEIKQYIAREKKVLSDQSSILSFRVGHWHVQTINMTYQSVTIEIKIAYIYEQ